MVARLATGREHKVVADVVAASKAIVSISKGLQAIHQQYTPATSINNSRQQRSEAPSAEER
jgi:hypothetical protein